jgi:PAS domain S-box-containing protein
MPDRKPSEHARRQSDAQHAFLLSLSDALRPLADVEEIQEAAARLLGQHLGVAWAHYGEIDPENATLVVRRSYASGVPSLVGTYPIESSRIHRKLDAGETVVIDDIATDAIVAEETRAQCAGLGMRSFVGVPLVRNGTAFAVVVAAHTATKHWSAAELDLIGEVSKRTEAATLRAATETALRASEEKYRKLFATMDEGYCTYEVIPDENGRVVDLMWLEANAAFERHIGFSDVIGKRLSEIMPGAGPEAFDMVTRVYQTGVPERIENLQATLGRWYSSHCSRVGGDGSRIIAAIFEDITERKKAEAALSESEARFRAIAEQTDAGVAMADREGRLIWVNDRLAEIVARQPDDTMRLSIQDYTHPDDWEENERLFRRMIEDGVPFVLEKRLGHPDGGTRWNRVSVSPRRDAGGRIVGGIAVAIDISDRKLADEGLRESEERMRLAIASTGLGTFDWDLATDRVVVNARFREIVGLPAGSEVIASAMMDGVVHPDDRDWVGARIAAAMDPSSSGTYEFEHRAATSYGVRWLLTSGQVHFAGEGDGRRAVRIVGNDLDITERKKAEASLRESEEQQAFLLELTDALRPLTDPEAIQHEAMRLLGQRLGASRAQYYTADETGEYLSSSGGYTDGVPAAIGKFRLIEFGKYAYDGFHAGETQVVSDARTDPRISAEVLRSYKTVGFLAYIGVPFVQRGRFLGTIAVHQAGPRAWTDAERVLIEETAERAGVAVEHARAEQALRASDERQAFLLKLSDMLRPLSDPSEIQEAACRVLGEYLGVSRAFYGDAEHDQDTLVIGPGYSHDTFPLEGVVRFSEFELDMIHWYRAGHTYVIDDTEHDSRFGEHTKSSFRAIEVRAALGVPLVKEGRIRAIFSLHQTTPRQWTNTDIALLEETAERTWAAIERARAEAEVRSLNETLEQRVTERTSERDALRRQLVQAEEAERQRLSRELHDELGQQLTAFRLGLEDAGRLAATQNEERASTDALLLARIGQLKTLADTMMRGARYIALELRPPELDDVGLASALETYAREWAARYDIAAEFTTTASSEINSIERTIPLDIASALYRIAQEGLTNVAKHARATQVSIVVDQRDTEVRLIIEDNGQGFDVDEARARAREQRRLGLGSMEERAVLLGGRLVIESALARGTTIYVRVPLGR